MHDFAPDVLQRVEAIDYRLLLEHIPAIVYVAAFDADSSTVYVSPQIETLLGYSQTEWMADHTFWRTRIHPDDRTRVLSELVRIRGGEEPISCEYRMLARDGHIVWFCDDATIQRDRCGHPMFLYGVMLDITERKQLEMELSAAQHLLSKHIKSHLDTRDLEILRLIHEGYTDREISNELAIAERTVRYCLQRVYTEFNVSRRSEAVREAIRLNLITTDLQSAPL